MGSSVVWIRFFDHAFSALAFATITVVSLWLASRKFIGHRTLLVIAAAFTLVRSLTHCYLAYRAFQITPPYTLLTLACTTASALVGMALAVKVIISLPDLELTLTRTEAQHLLREDREKDAEQVQTLLRFVAEGNRDQSAQLLAKMVQR